MTLREQLLLISDRYCAAAGIGRKRVSTIVMNGGGKLDAIANGSDLTTGSFEKAMLWFSANWPAGAAWPDSVMRPEAPPSALPGISPSRGEIGGGDAAREAAE